MTSSPADFSFSIGRVRGRVVMRVQGKLDLARSTSLGGFLADLIQGQGNLGLDVDLRDVTVLDPAGLGAFSVAAELVAGHGGDLSITPPDAFDASGAEAFATPCGPHDHLVEFYDSEEALGRSVSAYLEPGVREGAAVIVVATEAHRRLFAAELDRAGVDVEAARTGGTYLEADAEETLARFMVKGGPNEARFEATIGALIEAAAGCGRPVRVYGEMVALLWSEGNVAGALALEDLWNDLATRHEFSLLCAYPVSAFDTSERQGEFRAVCDRHG